MLGVEFANDAEEGHILGAEVNLRDSAGTKGSYERV